MRCVVTSGLRIRSLPEPGPAVVLGGAAWNGESFSPTAPQPAFTRNSGEACLGDDLTCKAAALTALHQNAASFANLTNTGEYRVNFDLGANTKVAGWLIWNGAVSDRFLSNPVPGRQKNDLLYTTGIGVTFLKVNRKLPPRGWCPASLRISLPDRDHLQSRRGRAV